MSKMLNITVIAFSLFSFFIGMDISYQIIRMGFINNDILRLIITGGIFIVGVSYGIIMTILGRKEK